MRITASCIYARGAALRIIIEGPDAEGKTVVAKAIANRLMLDYVHCGKPDSKEELIALLQRDFTVFDRSWLGELIYPAVLDNRQPLISIEEINRNSPERIRTLYVLLTSRGPTGFHPVEQELVVNHKMINNLFIEAFGKITGVQKVVFNTLHFTDVAELIDVVREFAVRWANKMPMVYPPTVNDYKYTYFEPFTPVVYGEPKFKESCICGHFQDHKKYGYWRGYNAITEGYGNDRDPKVLFLGEAPGKDGCGKMGVPFYGDRSGMLFRNALFWKGYAETEVWITNVSKCTPAGNKLSYIYAKQCYLENTRQEITSTVCRIVAVGKTAEKILTAEGIGFFKVYHPAYCLYKGIPISEYNAAFASSF